ncbi:MAG: heavy metal translocating P-type ATPase [bacterium]
MKIKAKIIGMHCASCASIIEKTLRKDDAVKSVSVNFGTEKAKIDFDDTQTNISKLSESIKPLGYEFVEEDDMNYVDHDMSNIGNENKSEVDALKKNVIIGLSLAFVSVVIMVWDILSGSSVRIVPEMSPIIKTFFHHLLPIMATYMLFVIGLPYLKGVWRFFRFGKANMDTLIGIGTGIAFLYSFIVTAFENVLRPYLNVDFTYYDVTIVVIALITFGKYLEASSKVKTGEAIKKLMHLQAKTAIVVRNGKEIELPVDQVVIGDILRVKPGMKISVDGEISDGISSIDESMITGESVPVDKKTADLVIGGTINKQGSFLMKATQVGKDTMLAKIISMVEDAQGSKAPIQALADKISAVFVPIVLVISVVALSAWLFFGITTIGFSSALSYGLTAFVGVLVIACPCALGLATPTAIIVGVGKGAERGILVKDAESLQKLSEVDTVVFDKTGTITKGEPSVTNIISFNEKINDQELLKYAASLEGLSEHPLAQAILNKAEEEKIQLEKVIDFEALEGVGVAGYLLGELFSVTKPNANERNNQHINTLEQEGKTVVIVKKNEVILGIVALSDTIKDGVTETIKRLHAQKIKTVMLTGDNARAAAFIAREAGIDEVIAEVLPQDKAAKIKSLQEQGAKVAMAGDGVNDAPALVQADVGIAMATGTDVAIESAGITLLQGDIRKLADAISLAKATMRTVKQNLFWAFIYNVVGIPLAAGVLYPVWGILLSPVFAGVAMAGSSVSVVTNSLRLKVKKLK